MKRRRSIVLGVTLLCPLLAFTGCTKRLAFATATKFGLDISQRADQTAEVSMGYDRVELVSIPSVSSNGTIRDPRTDEDTYSVLGTLLIRYGNPFIPPREGLHIHQFFATGRAALKIVENKHLRDIFARDAAQIFTTGQDATTDPKR